MPKPSRFKHPYKHYAEKYGVNVNTIKAAVAEGIDLDNAEQCQLRFAAAGAARADQSAGELPPGQAVPAAGPGREPQAHAKGRKRASTGKLGLAAALPRLREAEHQAHADYKAATADGDKARMTHTLKQWLALQDALLKAEKANPDVAEQNKKSIAVDDLEQSLSKTFQALRRELENLTSRVERMI